MESSKPRDQRNKQARAKESGRDICVPYLRFDMSTAVPTKVKPHGMFLLLPDCARFPSRGVAVPKETRRWLVWVRGRITASESQDNRAPLSLSVFATSFIPCFRLTYCIEPRHHGRDLEATAT